MYRQDLRVRWRSVLHVQLQGLQRLLLLDEVRGVESHVLMEDLVVLGGGSMSSTNPNFI